MPTPIPPPVALPKPAKRRLRWGKKHTVSAILGVFVALILVFVAVSAVVALSLKAKLESAKLVAVDLQTAVKAQDLVTANAKLSELNTAVISARQTYRGLGFWRLTPLRAYYLDGEAAFSAAGYGLAAGGKLLGAVEPYADVLGLKGEGSYTGGTAEDRIVKIIETAGTIAPVLGEVETDLASMDQALNQINPERYPFAIQGRPVSALIQAAQSAADGASQTVSQFKPTLEQLPAIAGLNSPKKYLVIFQNDGELRPTGGFMTAYSVLKVDKGKITPEKSDDIYDLDDKFTKALVPPEMLKKYLLTLRWNLRDMNVSPDFKASMDQFISHYETLPGESPVDGIIAIDTQLLADLVTVLGPIDVPGYGRFSADIDPRCNCPGIIYELEDISTKPTPYFRSDRKAILGPMMGTILAKAYATDNNAWPALFQTVWRNINEKHVLFYFKDQPSQTAAETLGVAGRIPSPQTNRDFFMVVDANLGGAKSNMFIRQEVDQDIQVSGNQVTKKVTLTYKNPQKGSNCNLEAGQLCLNGKLPSWIRIYLPQGSQLLDTQGLEAGSQSTYEDLGYTVVEGVYKIDPESIAKIELNYTVPYTPGRTYDLDLVKQPGTKAPRYTVRVNGAEQALDLTQDQSLTFPL